jgi:hypothetical protein
VLGRGGIVLVECSSGNVVHHGGGCSPGLVVGGFSDLYNNQQDVPKIAIVMFH